MELFQDKRIKIGNSILSRRVAKAKRKVSFTNIDQVKDIGIVWDATNIKEFSFLSKFHQKMHERQIEVKIIGYYPGKELPDQYTALRYLSCIRRNEINLFYIPVSTESDFFIKKPFDVLIDINFNNVFPLTYVTSLSSARLKVGLFDAARDDSVFDLMIELKKPFFVEGYLNELIRYLEMIKSGS